MNLIELFDRLEIPEQSTVKTLSAVPLPGYPNFRIAVDVEGSPVLLFSPESVGESVSLKNVRLKYLSVIQNVECKVIEDNASKLQPFTLITFTSSDRHLQEYFLRISESLIKSLGIHPSEQQIVDTLFKFVEVFRALSDAPTNTVQGLWAELFIISSAHQPRIFLEYWHSVPEEKFDFNANEERIEVKSSTSMERVHIFSSDQLCPPQNVQVLVASLLLKQTNLGTDIRNLVDNITSKLADDLELIDKLHSNVCKTLGSSLEYSIAIKFDLRMAQDSLRFYRHQDIKRIDSTDIPSEVSEVRYRSDLSNIPPVDITQLKANSRLFSSF